MLTEMQARKAAPAEKPYKLADERGMYLLVNKAGKYWRFDYRFGGKRQTLALGVYPEVGLQEARRKRDEAREALREGKEPTTRGARHAGTDQTLRVLAEEWFANRRSSWADSNASKIRIRLDNDILPWLGKYPITQLDAPTMLEALRRIEARGAIDTAHRCLRYLNAIFRYAIATSRANSNPAADLRDALKPIVGGHYATITEPKQIGSLLRAMDGYAGDYTTRAALQLAPLFFVRPGELRQAEWSEFDLDAALWRIPAERMKMPTPHLVPLATQAIAILRELHPLTGEGRYLFGRGKRPMSNNTVNAALRRMGYGTDDMTGHGFRAMASTRLHEMGWQDEVIERQLAHQQRNKVASAYNYAQYLPERTKLMQAWANYLDKLRATGAPPASLGSGRAS